MSQPLVRVITEPVSFTPCTGTVIALAGSRAEPAILDSASPDPRQSRYTIVACEPIATFTARSTDGDPFDAMRYLLAATGMLEPDRVPADLAFAGGWIGYFAYEASRFIERLPANVVADVGMPLARFALYDSAAVYDHDAGCWSIVAADFGEPGADLWNSAPHKPGQFRQLVKGPGGDRREPAQRVAWWRDLLAAAAMAESCSPAVSRPADPPSGPPYGPVVANISRQEHLQMVARGREYIAAGDIFQVNLARRESVRAVEEPLHLYQRLRQANPGAYSAFLSWNADPTDPRLSAADREAAGLGSDPSHGDSDASDVCAVLSSSPELFLDVRGREVVTRPIKGTRPRSADPAIDESLRLELAASSKDRAELAMIVDLERNDLGRVCEFGSVRVVPADSPASPYTLERHATVHHLSATVTGRLAAGRDAIDLLRATFPGGSITGAPKVRAMEIIDELEPTERSVYTGAIGYFAPGGRMVMNIAIRTIIQARGMLHWYAGGGIVADSDPVAEYDETCAKALGMRQALGLSG